MALRAGVDSERANGTVINLPGLSARYRDALKRDLISEKDIDQSLIRLFSARYRVGDLGGLRAKPDVPMTAVNSLANQQLALKAATQSLVTAYPARGWR
ncbi:hypothetical protein [Sphingobium lactosutens]|uniref:hypothetical protein n=1 Tax=Sphingobium lactosutens TaxID=522773 RepID=UPI00211741D3|nr:hypothetical protein [Sphingobium lactosutens]